jgi:hypothetical protein
MPYLTNSTPPGLGREATDAALLAALYAMRTYPDPVGALMNRELRDYIQNGYPATADRATCRLVTELRAARRSGTAGESRRARLRLPAPNHAALPRRGDGPSVHPGVIGRRVQVVADLERVRVFREGRTVADHKRVWARHQTISDPERAAAARLLRRSGSDWFARGRPGG